MTPAPAVREVPVGRAGVAAAVFGGAALAVIAGPCVIEEEAECLRTAEALSRAAARLKLPFVFKASYLKDNRTSRDSFTGPGIERGLEILSRVRREVGVPVTTDIHSREEAARAAAVVDLLQIPAFLCRQTSLLVAAGGTGLPVNIKKGQFVAPSDIAFAAEKAVAAGAAGALLTERGTSFGYGDLVVDIRSFEVMRGSGWPAVYDATHSLQRPGGATTGGERRFLLPLARAAVAGGADAVFLEAHPDPSRALSDRATQVPLEEVEPVLASLARIRESLAGGGR
jgi:2-dehydro-3-deoxyphosphooctonate aldolase (KDO 8-P synthase)